MSKVQTLRALVNERLAAAAEEVSELFERATAEYEEELCLSEEENQRTQQLLDQALSRRVLMNQGLNQDFTETAWIKEEPEEQKSGAVRVKTEESSELQQRQTEHREETQGEDISSETHFHSETEGHTEHSSDTDNDDDWEPPFSCSAAQMETEADGENYNQVQSRDRSTKLSPNNKSAPETTVHKEDKSGPDGAEKKKHQCSVCQKRFGRKQILLRHIRVHTGERPYSCSTCNKAFKRRSHLITHRRTHTGEKPYSCTTCSKAFKRRSHLITHRRTHTGEKPYSCTTCSKAFTQQSNFITHKRTHTGEKPYSCTTCSKAFTQRSNFIRHRSTHCRSFHFVLLQ
uniref:C2H2-type domain-containing protein n=1 Tax=Neogobius melanostomus TaxID=47308 RepID=A0A8C6WWV9_9GOBI